MKPLTKSLILSSVVLVYAILYIATSYGGRCDEDCQTVFRLDSTLRNKYDYVWGVQRCIYRQGTDSLCIMVKDTVGIDWDRFADTVCTYSNSIGLRRQEIFILRNSVFPPDTLARKRCP